MFSHLMNVNIDELRTVIPKELQTLTDKQTTEGLKRSANTKVFESLLSPTSYSIETFTLYLIQIFNPAQTQLLDMLKAIATYIRQGYNFHQLTAHRVIAASFILTYIQPLKEKEATNNNALISNARTYETFAKALSTTRKDLEECCNQLQLIVRPKSFTLYPWTMSAMSDESKKPCTGEAKMNHSDENKDSRKQPTDESIAARFRNDYHTFKYSGIRLATKETLLKRFPNLRADSRTKALSADNSAAAIAATAATATAATAATATATAIATTATTTAATTTATTTTATTTAATTTAATTTAAATATVATTATAIAIATAATATAATTASTNAATTTAHTIDSITTSTSARSISPHRSHSFLQIIPLSPLNPSFLPSAASTPLLSEDQLSLQSSETGQKSRSSCSLGKKSTCVIS